MVTNELINCRQAGCEASKNKAKLAPMYQVYCDRSS